MRNVLGINLGVLFLIYSFSYGAGLSNLQGGWGAPSAQEIYVTIDFIEYDELGTRFPSVRQGQANV